MAKTAETTGPAAGDTGGGQMAALGRRAAAAPPGHASLSTEHGQTQIADRVVAKIASMATREIPGVQSMGKGLTRRVGQLREMMPGADGGPSQQGVSVEVGERETAVDLDVVTWYGQSIADVTDAVRQNVIDRVQGMTGLDVVEVNIYVDDIVVEGEQEQPGQQPGGR
jgi:uncharacterized alkaline shock family protein YloU